MLSPLSPQQTRLHLPGPMSSGCKPGPDPPHSREPPAHSPAPCKGFLTVIGRASITRGQAGGGEEGRKANFVSQGETRLLLTAVRRKAKARARVI